MQYCAKRFCHFDQQHSVPAMQTTARLLCIAGLHMLICRAFSASQVGSASQAFIVNLQ